VVGIPVPLRLYELLEFRSDVTPEMLEMVNAWERAFKAYEELNFAGAKETFASIYRNDSGDKTAKLYLERCEKYTASPPPEDWDGVDNLTEK
jgi:adenylate cyclase